MKFTNILRLNLKTCMEIVFSNVEFRFTKRKHLNKFSYKIPLKIFVDDFITSVRPRCKRVHSDMVNFPRRRHYIIRITPCLDDIS